MCRSERGWVYRRPGPKSGPQIVQKGWSLGCSPCERWWRHCIAKDDDGDGDGQDIARSPEVEVALCELHYLSPLMCSPPCGPKPTSLPVHYRSVISPQTFIQLLPFAGPCPSVDMTPPTPSYWLDKIPDRSGLASIYPSNSSWQSSWSTCSSLKDQKPHIQWHSFTSQDSGILRTLHPAYTAHILRNMPQLCTATFMEMNLILSFMYNRG